MILTVNSGSTSVKLAAFSSTGNGEPQRVAQEQCAGGQIDARAALRAFTARLAGAPLRASAHRVVHGGGEFSAPTVLDARVEARIAAFSQMAPLHNPVALKWIDAAREVCGAGARHVAVFDTAFFAALPPLATQYAVARDLASAHGVRRYGFHGMAHQAMWQRWCALRPGLAQGGRLITLQLGGGCSIAAIRDGRPLDTSMGFSPLEGLVMATRCGDIDAAVVPYLGARLALTAQQVIDRLESASGLLGLSGCSGDMRVLLRDTSPPAQFAIDLYCERARKFIGAYLVVLGGCDGIVFGGGVGEHAPEIRARILQGMEWLGIALDRQANARALDPEISLSASGGAVDIRVVAVDEERALAAAAVSALNDPR